MTPNLAEFEHAGIRLLGFSLAGEESFVVVPELNLSFDFGRAPHEVVAVDHILLTHGHMDHAAGVSYYCSQRKFIDNAPGHIYLAEPLIGPIRRLLQTWADIDGQEPDAHFHAVRPGDFIELRRDLAIRPFAVNHNCRQRDRSRVPAFGFSVVDVRYKLKAEFSELSGPQLVERKKQGIEITRRVEVPLVTNCGDTGPGDFVHLDHVRDSKILLLECTFVDDEHHGRARAGRHMHITDLPDMLSHLRNERILLTHLSRRTHLSEARRRLKELLKPSDLERVSFLMEYRRRTRRRPPNAPAG